MPAIEPTMAMPALGESSSSAPLFPIGLNQGLPWMLLHKHQPHSCLPHSVDMTILVWDTAKERNGTGREVLLMHLSNFVK